MNRSETLIKIAPALLKAQQNIGAAKKDAKNPFFKSSYADLGSVMEVCKQPLNDQGISIWQPVGTDEVGVYVETILLHESGEYMSDKMRIAAKSPNDPQAQGSAITYARRYGLQSMVFIPAEDDDAEKAVGRATVRTEEKRVVSEPKITEFQRKKLYALLPDKGKTEEDLHEFIKKAYNKTSVSDLLLSEATKTIRKIELMPDINEDIVDPDDVPDF